MLKEFERFSIIIGDENLEKLHKSHIAIFGLGGVGGACAEALARSGVGNLTLVDYDDVDITNINRQIPALHSNIGKMKTEVLKDRFKDINPEINIKIIGKKFTLENIDVFFEDKFDYVVDAIDMVSSKIHLIRICCEKEIPLISSMGMGNKIDPSKIKIANLNKTHTCPLAKTMRKELKNYGITNIKCVFSDEEPIISKKIKETNTKIINGSSSFVPPVAGIFMASHIVRELIS